MEGFCSLASGSKGNALYLGTNRTKILVDAGISTKTLEKRLAEIEVHLHEIDAILVSHEHIDHIKAIETLSSKYQIPIFANSETAKAICSQFQVRPKFKIFSTEESFVFNDLHIHPFSIQHDTVDPVAFTIQIDGLKVGICTDLGFVTSSVKRHLQSCHYLLVEANHDPLLVHASSRSSIYKKRVLSRLGHLSNEDCAELLKAIFHEQMRHILLAHLSSECNRPELALEKMFAHLPELQEKGNLISIALQDRISQKILF